MAFTVGTATFTAGSDTVTNVQLTSGNTGYFASGTRVVVGVNPIMAEVEAISAPTSGTFKLRMTWPHATGTYPFLANMTSEGLRVAAIGVRDAILQFQATIDSIPGETEDIYGRSNILGTVSEISGVPTGAIIESGSNANGSYVKYANGTMICTSKVSKTEAISTAFMGGYKSANFTQVFPVPFIGDPTVSPPVAIGAFGTAVVDVTASQIVYSLLSISSQASVTSTVHITAIGRWF